jgi:hypothetical protein
MDVRICMLRERGQARNASHWSRLFEMLSLIWFVYGDIRVCQEYGKGHWNLD